MQGKFSVVSEEAVIGTDVRIYDFVNIYGKCRIGDDSVIGGFVEIQPGVEIGARVKVSSHCFLCTGVIVKDEAFIGHGVMFTNDLFPKAVFDDGRPFNAADTEVVPTVIESRAAIGSGCTILCGITIGEGALVGAGSVVTKDVPPHTLVAGNPAKVIRKI
ncbi:acyltransferase [Pseudodesulfovibrio sp.]|uniref:acyltransferase n=1 Tax=unclassified Pseudodesulfovibrio TaxID=2661612 RepID=UPI003B0079B5